jgi:D-alanine-D-alanine ligase
MSVIVIDVLCGGRSAEHEISLISASAILDALLKLGPAYRIYPVFLSCDGGWYRSLEPVKQHVSPKALKLLQKPPHLVSPSFFPDQKVYFRPKGQTAMLPSLFFPVLHGPHGEDGTLQGLFETLGIPYVGCGVLASSLGMDKVLFRRVAEALAMPVLPWVWFTKEEYKANADSILSEVTKSLSPPWFVKPSRMGSSIGINKVSEAKGLPDAIQVALEYDSKIVIEEGRVVREIECAVLGGVPTRAAPLGEIIPGADYYDFEDKYSSGKTRHEIPANLPEELREKLSAAAKKIFFNIGGSGLARVDFFIEPDASCYYLNEINTFPGFTANSMYPKMWEAMGMSYQELLETLIRLALLQTK